MNHTIIFIKRYKAFFIVIIMGLVVAQCTSTKSVTIKIDPFIPQLTDITIAKTHWPAATQVELTEGYDIYNTKCNDCHDRKDLLESSAADWPGIMKLMGRKAKLDSTDYHLVWQYIVSRREALVLAKK